MVVRYKMVVVIMKKRLSNHAKYRCKQRFGVSNKIIKDIMLYGNVAVDYEGAFHDFLISVKNSNGSKSIGVKVKDDMAVVYNKRSQRAITCYRVPNKYTPSDNYLIPAIKKRKKNNLIDDKQLKRIMDDIWTYLNSANKH